MDVIDSRIAEATKGLKADMEQVGAHGRTFMARSAAPRPYVTQLHWVLDTVSALLLLHVRPSVRRSLFQVPATNPAENACLHARAARPCLQAQRAAESMVQREVHAASEELGRQLTQEQEGRVAAQAQITKWIEQAVERAKEGDAELRGELERALEAVEDTRSALTAELSEKVRCRV